MKKFFTLLLACSSYSLFAQHEKFARVNDVNHSRHEAKQTVTDNTTWYGRIGAGYAFTQAGQINSLLGTPYSGNSTFDATGRTETSFNYKKASMNAGVNAAIAAGRMLGPHIGLELAVQFNVAPSKYTFNGQNLPIAGGGVVDATTINQAKFPIFLIPAVVFQSQIHNMLEGYGRFGLVLPLNTKVNTSVSTYGQLEYTSVQSARFNLGFSGALGLKYALRSGLRVWGEFNVMSLSVYTKKEVLTDPSGLSVTQ
ncbi:MAG: hypothetical protein JSS96_04665, partial [Bacteroidetes bacterium]|nr:hypothetical protein [Bacteroidota bacterium]